MNEPLSARIQFFRQHDDYAVVQRRLPHWSQAGTVSFITWRTWDSMPEQVLQLWLARRDQWLAAHGIDATQDNWRSKLQLLDAAISREFQLQMSDRWNEHLDAGHGACVLKRPELAKIVVNSLLHFDGDRHELLDFVVMPNHIHLLAAFPEETAMLRQCESWKHFSAAKMNRALGRQGRFWQQEDFDHLVRSPEQFDYLRHYIADNPTRARLKPGEYAHFSKPL
jgi:type I restriction enzyme R subunit